MPHAHKLRASERAKAAQRRELARLQEGYLVTLEEENTATSTSVTLVNDDTDRVAAVTVGAALSVSGLSVEVIDEQGQMKSELALKHIMDHSREQQSGTHEKDMIASKDRNVTSARVVRFPPPPPPDVPISSSKSKPRKTKVSSDLTNRYSPSAASASKVISPQNSRTLQELAELRAKKLSKFIQSQFATMAERNAAVKAAEEAIYAQLVAKQNKSPELSDANKSQPKRLEDALGMVDQIYLKIRQQEEERRQKYREYMKGSLHEHEYVEATPVLSEKVKIIPSQFRGAASVDPDKCSAVVGGGSVDEVDERSMEVTVPTLAEQIDSKAAFFMEEAEMLTCKSSLNASTVSAKKSKNIDIPDIFMYRDGKEHVSVLDVHTGKNEVEYSYYESSITPNKSTIPSTMASEKSSSPLITPSFEINMAESSPCESPYIREDVSHLIKKQELALAILRAEEMVRLMAQEVDWLAHPCGDEFSIASSIELDDDISTLSQCTRSSLRSIADGAPHKFPLCVAGSPLSQKKLEKPSPPDRTWIAYWSDEHQREYYYNPGSKEVVWKIPDEDETPEKKAFDSAALSLSYDDGTVDSSYVVPVRDFMRRPKNQCEDEKCLKNADSSEPLQPVSLKPKSRQKRFRFAFVMLGTILFVRWIALYGLFRQPFSQILEPRVSFWMSGYEGRKVEQISKRFFSDTAGDEKNLLSLVVYVIQKASYVEENILATMKSLYKSRTTVNELPRNVAAGYKGLLGTLIQPVKMFYSMWGGSYAHDKIEKTKGNDIQEFIALQKERFNEDLTLKAVVGDDKKAKKSLSQSYTESERAFYEPMGATSAADDIGSVKNIEYKELVFVSQDGAATSLIVSGSGRNAENFKNKNGRNFAAQLQRPKICFMPLSWLLFPGCRNLANYAPLFDVDSPEFMKYW
jgi:hypothetical protein